MDLFELIKNRYSVKDFDENKEIDKDVIEKILEMGRFAPTAVNGQPQRVYVLKSREALDKFDKVCSMRYHAPVVLMVCIDKDKVWKHPLEDGYDTSEMDASIVTTHMMLGANSMGVGSCWIRYFARVGVKKIFGLSSNISPVCFLLLGYPSDTCQPLPKHFSRLPLEDTVTYL